MIETFKGFVDYVEVRTKITSTFAFLLSIAYLLYLGQPIRWSLMLIFFGSMFIFDLTTTAVNNYIDTKTNGQVLPFSRKTALHIIYAMFVISTSLGLLLAYSTDIVVLLIGGLCFLCGIFYTYGPIPLSRQPLGEVFSGFFYGVLIPFLILYINSPAGTYLSWDFSWQRLSFSIAIWPFVGMALLAIAPFCATANIMLANNICDLEKDITVKRFTLPFYLEHKALHLFAGLYYAVYVSSVLMVIFGIVSPWYLLSLVTIIPLRKNIRTFFQKQEKATTFILSVKNYVLIMGGNSLAMFLCAAIA